MKAVALLHHDLEWPEKTLKTELEKHDFKVVYQDIRHADIETLKQFDVILNRVYASVANRDYPSLKKTLELIQKLANCGIRCLNSTKATFADYNKYHAYSIQTSQGISVPVSHLLQFISVEQMAADIIQFALHNGYPVVVKPNSGGRGKDIFRINKKEDVFAAADRAAEKSLDSNLDNKWLLQQFIHSVKDFDCRLSVVAGQCVAAWCRSLVATPGSDAWIGSRSMGSVCEPYTPNDIEIELALAATQAIEADCNVVDIVLSYDGPFIIENNPTPDFKPNIDSEGFKHFIDAVIKIVKTEGTIDRINPHERLSK